MTVFEPRIPADLRREEMPDLLRHWHLGSRARRHLSRRRFAEVTGLLAGRRGRTLDAGCGWGYNLLLLARAGFAPVGVDIVQGDFRAARAIARENGIDIALAGGDLGALPFVSGSFAAVTAVETIEHVFAEDRAAALREVRRVLGPGGALALSTPNHQSIVESGKRAIQRFPALKRLFPPMCYPAGDIPRAAYHPYRYHRPIPARELRRMLEEAGFRVAAMRTIVFVWKNAPDALMPAALAAEWALERIPGVRRLASTLLVLAERVESGK